MAGSKKFSPKIVQDRDGPTNFRIGGLVGVVTPRGSVRAFLPLLCNEGTTCVIGGLFVDQEKE